MSDAAHPQAGTVRRHMAELGAMSEQGLAIERQILQRAEQMLADVDGRLAELRPKALAGDEQAARDYEAAVLERGRLQRVIDGSNGTLRSS